MTNTAYRVTDTIREFTKAATEYNDVDWADLVRVNHRAGIRDFMTRVDSCVAALSVEAVYETPILARRKKPARLEDGELARLLWLTLTGAGCGLWEYATEDLDSHWYVKYIDDAGLPQLIA